VAIQPKNYNMQPPCLRKFPYPYQAAFALANDIDNTPSQFVFMEMMKLLNTTSETIFGKGFGLEISSSFWFFNATHSYQLSYFKNITREETGFASACRELWRSGHIDCLHTYGDFDEGRFGRKYAEMAIDELTKHSAKIQTWINHGNCNNIQNLGIFDHCYGDQPDHPAYHFDLLTHQDLRYIWSGKMTHVLGQNSAKTLNVKMKVLLQKFLAASKYRALKNKPFYLENDLIQTIQLKDGHRIWDFQRFVNNWGREQVLDSKELGAQIQPSNIQRLISNEGFLIVYTHMCEGLSASDRLPEKLYQVFDFLAEKYFSGELLVSTVSRLLKYSELIKTMQWNYCRENERLFIKIDSKLNNLDDHDNLTESDLPGITFYCEEPSNVSVFLGDRELPVQHNYQDHTGRHSVSIPWKKLDFPNF